VKVFGFNFHGLFFFHAYSIAFQAASHHFKFFYTDIFLDILKLILKTILSQNV